MATVSIIIPTFNDGDRLLRAVQSAASQTWPRERMEIIVVDDGSTDATAARMEQFIANAPLRMRYVRQENAGPAAARNHGLRLARGDVVAFLDADDRWQPDKLARQLPLLDGPVALVYCDAAFVDADGRPLDGYVRRIRLERGDILLPLFCDFFLLTSAVVLSAAAIARVGPFDEELEVGEDYEFFLRVARRFRADYVGDKLLVRCVRPDSLSRRDYARDARVDLATLTTFIETDRDFERRHRHAVRQRLARYRYDLAYRLLADKRRREAIGELVRSLRTQASLGAARTLARALLPLERPTRAARAAA